MNHSIAAPQVVATSLGNRQGSVACSW